MKNIVLLITLLSTLSFSEHITTIFQNGTYGYNGCEDVGISLYDEHLRPHDYYREILNTPDLLHNCGSASTLHVVSDGLMYSRFLIKFNNILDTIPQASVIVDARITFIESGNSLGDDSRACFSPLVVDWDVNEATWLESRDGEYWSVDSTQYTNYYNGEPEIDKIFHGGLYDAEVVTKTPRSTLQDSLSEQYPGRISVGVDVTEAVQQMVDGRRENYGFLGFEGRALTRSKYRYMCAFCSSESDYPPRLTVIYDPDSVRVNMINKKSVTKPFAIVKMNGFTALNFTHSDSYNLSIFDVMGKELKCISFFGTKIKIAHNEFSKGVHIVSVVGDNGDVFREKVIF